MAEPQVTMLTDLPDEIFSNFIFPAFHGDKSTLLDLCLVSHRFKDLAQQVLYKVICFRLRAPSKESHYAQSPGNIHTFDALVSTLTAHPRLRPYVQTVSINVFHHPYYKHFCSHSSLLSLTPNLRILTLSPPPVNLDLTHSDHPHLHTLTFDFNGTYNEEFEANDSTIENFKMALVARHFFLPSLRTFHTDALYFWPRGMGPVFFPPERYGTSRIESLQLERGGDCDGDIGYLQDMLKCIKSLKKFVFEVHVSWEGSHMRTVDLQALALRLLVKPFEHELTKLCIAASDAADFLRLNGKVLNVDGVKGFRGFENVKIFAVPEFFLVGDRDFDAGDNTADLTEEEATESVGRFVDCLPPGVEYLQVQYMHGFQNGKDPHWEVRIRRMEELARRKGEEGAAFGNLKVVVWWMQMAECWSGDGERYGPSEDLVALKKCFEDVGVEFGWMSEPYWEDTPFGECWYDK